MSVFPPSTCRVWPVLFLVLATALLAQSTAPLPPPQESKMAAFGKMIPEGFVNRGVVIPSFDEAGKKTSELHATTLTRIDSERLHATEVTIDILSDDPADNMRVTLPSALYHLNEEILRSEERSTIFRRDQETSGDTLVFDSRTSMGSMTGRVRTLIFDTGTETGHSTPAQQPAPKASN